MIVLILVLVAIAILGLMLHLHLDNRMAGKTHNGFCWHSWEQIGRFEGDIIRCRKCQGETPGNAWINRC
jgi:hypothetical protein